MFFEMKLKSNSRQSFSSDKNIDINVSNSIRLVTKYLKIN